MAIARWGAEARYPQVITYFTLSMVLAAAFCPPPSTKPGYAPADTPIRLLLNLITELDEAVQTKSHEIVSVQNRVVLINI